MGDSGRNSVFMEHLERIDSCGPQSGDQACSEGDEDEEPSARRERGEVAYANAVDETCGEAAECKRRDKSDTDADERWLHALRYDEGYDIFESGAEGEA